MKLFKGVGLPHDFCVEVRVNDGPSVEAISESYAQLAKPAQKEIEKTLSKVDPKA